MTSTWKVFPLLIVFAGLGSMEVTAQPANQLLTTPQVQLSEAEQAFDTTVRAFERYLFDAGAFAVDVTSDWTYSGSGTPTKGTNLFYVAVQTGGKYRIEAGSAEKGKAQYICASDSQNVTRLHRSAKYFSHVQASPTHDDLQHDALTLQTLSGSGVELLIRPQIRAQLIAQISSVKLIGDETLDGQPVTHMQLALIDRRQIDVWFSKQEKPLLMQYTTTERIPISAQEVIQLVTTSKFQWRVGGPLPAATFIVKTPPDARQVGDLLQALREGDLRRSLGQPAPLLELNDLAGNTVRLADYRGKNVIVLIFWASWCAPSTNSMDTLNAFVTEAEGNGAVVLAINLGETKAQVQAAVQQHQYRGRVLLDPDSRARDAYRFGELPTTVLIGRNGTIQSFQSGSTSMARDRIRASTTALLQGKELVPIQR